MLVLDDARERNLALGVVNHRVALPVLALDALGLEAQAAVLKGAQLVVEVLVDGAAVDNAVGDAGVLGDELAVLGVQQDLGIAEHALHHGGVAAHGDALPTVVEVVVVIDEAHGQALDDAGRKLGAAAAPLLFRVALDKLLEHVLADKGKGLFLEVGGLAFADLLGGFGLLALDDLLGFRRGLDAPHLREGVHVERQVVQLVLVAGNGAVHVVVELGELVDVVPHRAQRGMEDVRAVLVHVDAVDLFGVDIAGDMIAAVDYQAGFAQLGGLVRENGAGDAGADDKVVVMAVLHFGCEPLSCLFRIRAKAHTALYFSPKRIAAFCSWLRRNSKHGVLCRKQDRRNPVQDSSPPSGAQPFPVVNAKGAPAQHRRPFD